MAKIRPFRAYRPTRETAAAFAALPYDVYNEKEARELVLANPRSFLSIDRAETAFPAGQDPYADEVYEKARELLHAAMTDGTLEQDPTPCYYLYELTMGGRVQTGLVVTSSVDDYLDGTIKKHESTLAAKEVDRIRHVDACDAQTGPIFLAYRADAEVRTRIEAVKQREAAIDFTADDGVRHRCWVIDDAAEVQALTERFADIEHTYIADGHHRAASAVRVSEMRREANPAYTGEEPYNYFLSVLFPDEELVILDYNRVLMDLAGMDEEALLSRLSDCLEITEAGEEPYHPAKKGEMGFLLGGKWYRCVMRASHCLEDPVGSLDVAFLQREVLEPIWGITDPRKDKRIDFVGGIRGLSELEARVKDDAACAFAMYPTSIAELFAVADAGLLMPPKSTWFEPKLRSGLFIHAL